MLSVEALQKGTRRKEKTSKAPLSIVLIWSRRMGLSIVQALPLTTFFDLPHHHRIRRLANGFFERILFVRNKSIKSSECPHPTLADQTSHHCLHPSPSKYVHE